MNFTRRVEIAKHGFESVTLKLASEYDELKETCARHGIEISATPVRKVVERGREPREDRRLAAHPRADPRRAASPERSGVKRPEFGPMPKRAAWSAPRGRGDDPGPERHPPARSPATRAPPAARSTASCCAATAPPSPAPARCAPAAAPPAAAGSSAQRQLDRSRQPDPCRLAQHGGASVVVGAQRAARATITPWRRSPWASSSPS